MIVLLLLVPGVVVPALAFGVARLFRDVQYDRAVLRILMLLCAAGWAFSGVQLPRLAWPLTSQMDGPGVSMGPLWLAHVLLWAVFGLPAIPLTFVAMWEYGARRRQERVLLIPVVMVAICILSATISVIWTNVARSARRDARREYVRQRQRDEDAPRREAQARASKLRQLQRQKAAPWREQEADVTFDGETVVMINFDHRPSCDLSLLRESPELKELSLVVTPVDDEDLSNLVYVPHLKRLALVDTGTTDADMKHVSQLRELRELYLYKASVSPQVAISLQIANPGLTVLGVSGMPGRPRNEWTRDNWNEVRRILGQTAFQDALREAGLDGVPPDAPEERPEGAPAVDDAEIESPAEPIATP